MRRTTVIVRESLAMAMIVQEMIVPETIADLVLLRIATVGPHVVLADDRALARPYDETQGRAEMNRGGAARDLEPPHSSLT